MKTNWNVLMTDSVDIQRADVDIDISTIRDRRVTKYDTISSSVRCYFEPGPVSYNFDGLLGQTAVKSFNVYFNGGVSVREGDRLKKSSDYYLVRSVQDYSNQGMGVVCFVEHKKYPMGT